MTKVTIRAEHVNGYTKMSITREGADAASALARIVASGSWRNVRTEPYAPAYTPKRRQASWSL